MPDRPPRPEAEPAAPPSADAAALAQLLAAQRDGLPYAPGPLPGPTLGGIPVGLLAGAARAAQQVQVWQGQFPPPEAIEKYEVVLPGSFDRMIRMAERLQEAQIEETRQAQRFARDDIRRGHWLGFAATMAAILGAIVCVAVAGMTHQSGILWVAGALVGVPVMAVAKSLVETARTPSARELMQATGTAPGEGSRGTPADPG
ncbi:MAG: DUF2335 domain-containing protein [Acetobacteraceae bacterium]